MKPLLSIIIPAYNGEPYIDISTHSVINQRLIEEDLVNMYEIIIVNDGSKDNTKKVAGDIAKYWNKRIRKDFIRVINKENGQYGSVINRGIQEAQGIYFKVLDCDDSLHTTSFIKLLYELSSIEKKVDVVFTDHSFEKVESNKQIIQSLRKWFVPNKVLNIQKQPFPHDVITMHSILYRTDFLRDIDFKQVEGVYYSDSHYSIVPLSKASTMYYSKSPLYRYYIGRSDQSININVMVKNRHHQIIVFEAIFKELNIDEIKSPYMKKYCLSIMKQMIQWQAMIISFDKTIPSQRKEMLSLMKFVRLQQPKYSKKILNNSLFNVIKITRGFGLSRIIRIGIKIYSKFKKNIMSDWD